MEAIQKRQVFCSSKNFLSSKGSTQFLIIARNMGPKNVLKNLLTMLFFESKS